MEHDPSIFWTRQFLSVSKNFKKNTKYISGIFVAFNTNMDAIEHITPDFLKLMDIEQFRPKKGVTEINSLDDFKTGLIGSMRLGKAMEWVIDDMSTYNHLLDSINYDSYRIGGQAGIVANVLSHLGMKKITVYNPKLSEAEADMYDPEVQAFKVSKTQTKKIKAKDAFSRHDTPKINLIFEYSKGLKIKTEDESFIIPRTNRFIVSYRPKGREPFFDDLCADNLKLMTKGVNRAFLSGYQYLSTDAEFFKAKVQLGLLRHANKKMKTHFEFTSEEDLKKVSKIIKYILPEVDSLGCNERETCILLNAMGEKDLADKIRDSGYGAKELYDGMRFIKIKTGLRRIHTHNINFMLCLTDKDYASPKLTRDALMFSVESAFAKSIKGFIHHAVDISFGDDVPVNQEGLKQIKLMDRHLLNKLGDGIYSVGKSYLVMVPTKLGGHAKVTVGLGDTVSSTAFVGDQELN
ncbi:MAG: hypothetical protein GQ477_01705 [Nanohaloarchaea archaeon]|nr:hypothetical protein [Candidatus Nanohaloarchaea archaeon]